MSQETQMPKTDQNILGKKEPDNKLQVISLVDSMSDHALGCTGCGSVEFSAEKAEIMNCSHCSTRLIPQEEARADTIAGRSSLADCQNYVTLKKSHPVLEILGNTGNDAFTPLRRMSDDRLKGILDDLKGGGIKKDQIPFLEQEFFEGLADRQRLMQAIVSIDNRAFNLIDGQDNYGSTAPNIIMGVANPDGTYSLVRAMNRNWENRYDCIYVEMTKINSSPRTMEELNSRIANNFNDEAIVDSSNLNYVTDGSGDSPFAAGEMRRHAEDLLLSIPRDRNSAVNYLKQRLGGTDSSLLSGYLTVQRLWFADALRNKTAQVRELGEAETNPIRTPLIPESKAREIDENFFIDALYSGQMDVKEGVAVNCGHCNATLSNYASGTAFIDCGSCGRFNDVVKTGRVSAEMLAVRKYSETFVPFDYFAELLSEREEADRGAQDSDPVSASRVLNLLSDPELPQSETERNEAFFQVINGVVKVMSANTHLLTRFDYPGKYGQEKGMSLAIAVPDKAKTVLATGESVPINAGIRGKVIIFKVEDFMSARYSGDFSWCKLKTQVVNPAEIEELKSVEQWDNELFSNDIPANRDQSWLDRMGLTGESIGSHTNFRKDSRLEEVSSRYYELLYETMAKIPAGSDLGRLLENK